MYRRFETRAADDPDRIALRFGAERLSYGALNARANRLAHTLIARGVAPGVPVALCVARSVDLPVGLLAILKAGGVYVPLDPEHPAERLRYILRDTAAALVITQGALAARLVGADVQRILLGQDAAAIARAPHHDPSGRTHADQLAYVMYTSGSTGRPKGVQIPHGALIERFSYAPYQRLMGPDDVLAAITAVSWNPSVYEVLYTLAVGATLALADGMTARDPHALKRFLADHGVTFMRAVPSLWAALIDAGWAGSPDMTIVTHGETLDPALAGRLARCGKGVWNTYGATEATVFSLVVPGDDGQRVISASDGPGRSGLVVLDDELARVPPGATGEIHIHGPVVARSYLNDPALTAQRFVADPVSGGRLYKTGDIARVLPDGDIALVGRRDHQVKIRGQRIELGEIEAVTMGCPGVAQAVVVASEDDLGEHRLVAYVVGEPGRPVQVAQVRESMAQKLPEGMVPATIVVVDALPLTAHGKVDRRALPPPERTRPALASAFVAPQTQAQRALAEIFAELLGCDVVGLDDNLFELGGHSLVAARIATRVAATFDVDLELAAFFEAPTVRTLSAEIGRRQARGDRSSLPPLRAGDPGADAPLSFAQERLWFIAQLMPGDVTYSLPKAWTLRGPLDVGALRAALQTVVERHEVLRTSFAADAAGRPRQTVHNDVTLELSVIDLCDRDPGERERLARAHLIEAARRPFDLRAAPLIVAQLLKRSASEHILFINVHHIASDGWSHDVLRWELAHLYRAPSTRLPALPVQVRDVARWQRAALSEVELDRQLAYWRAQLDGMVALALPTDRPRPRVCTSRGADQATRIGPALTSRLRALAQQHNASPFMVLLAAFKTLLFRYSGQEDIVVGSPISGRNAPETEGLIGLFVNTLVMRSTIAGDQAFSDVLRQVRRTALDAFAHQDLPFERLVGDLNPTRELGRNPLIQTAFALQNTPDREVPFEGLDCTACDLPTETSRLDLELHVWERDGGLDARLFYSTDLFDAWRMAQLLRHFETLLAQIVEAPDLPVADLELLSAEERHRLLVEWNATACPVPADTSVHQLFAAQARSAPDRLAVASGTEQLTYGELDERATRLAARLRGLGVAAGARVALCLDRSPALIAAVLAVWKAGGAYVPLSPDDPTSRLRDMLDDAGARVVLTTAAEASRFAGAEVETIAIDRDLARSSDDPANRPPDRPAPDQLAYVIYTSGSTGRPNGVAVGHASLVNFVLWHQRAHRVTADDRATLTASPAFDASLLETWPYLVTGASLHIPSDDTRRVPTRLIRWLSDEAITIAFIPPPLLELCFDAELPERLALRAVVTGGDRLRRRPSPATPFTVFNHYGPTECAVVATAGVVQPTHDADPTLPHIGRPIANAQVYILDPAMRPVPIGVAGELVIAGAGVALGYLGRPALTAQRFVPNPLGAGRVYRTGDRARFLPGGEIAFLGRIDDQVSLRGFRIEPGEVDVTIVACPGVAASITVLREDSPGDQRLVSYVVADSGPSERRAVASAEIVSQWRQLYDQQYAAAPSDADPEFNITGWNSSFTGAPIPPDDMREWRDATVAWISASRPQRVLEIGCGTGLVLYPLARAAARYVATDLSPRAVADLAARVASSPELRDKVELVCRPAHDFGWLASGETFDAVVLNSVVQYFPSVDYLSDVIEQAIARVSAGGRVFVGDVRDLDLAEAFYLAVARSGPNRPLSDEALRDHAASLARSDGELLVSRRFFHGLADRIPRISAVTVHPKRGAAATEMNRFRYDVTLTCGDGGPGLGDDARPANGENLGSCPLRRPIARRLVPELRAQLEDRLPAHMVPASIVIVDALPLTRQGKVDRRALPAPEAYRATLSDPYVPPRTTTQRTLAAIFEAALGCESVGIDDNFFALGGHSLIAVRIVTQAVARLGVELPIAAVFEAPTVAGLAARVDAAAARGASRHGLEDVAADPVRLPLTPMDVNFHYGKLFLGADDLAWVQVLEIEAARVDVDRLARAVLFAVDKHPIARGRLSSTTALGARQLFWDVSARLSAAPLITHELADELAADRVRDAVVSTPFPVDEAPGVRFVLLRTPRRDRLLVRYHHSGIDASGLHCLLASMMAHYLGVDDPARRVTPLSVGELCAFHAPNGRSSRAGRGVRGLFNRELGFLARLLPSRDPRGRIRWRDAGLWRPSRLAPAPIHGMGGHRRDRRCSKVDVVLSSAESRRLEDAAKRLRSTLDRLFIVGLVQGATAWNRAHSSDSRQVEAYWAINLRPPMLMNSIVANQFAWSRVRAPRADEVDAWVGEVLDPAADFLLPGALDWIRFVDRFYKLDLPDAVRWGLMGAIKEVMAPSMMISNTLAFSELDRGPFWEAFGVTRTTLHSPAGFSDRPVIVIGRRDGQITLRMIYRRTMFDPAGARRFLEACAATTLELAVTSSGRR